MRLQGSSQVVFNYQQYEWENILIDIIRLAFMS